MVSNTTFYGPNQSEYSFVHILRKENENSWSLLLLFNSISCIDCSMLLCNSVVQFCFLIATITIHYEINFWNELFFFFFCRWIKHCDSLDSGGFLSNRFMIVTWMKRQVPSSKFSINLQMFWPLIFALWSQK